MENKTSMGTTTATATTKNKEASSMNFKDENLNVINETYVTLEDKIIKRIVTKAIENISVNAERTEITADEVTTVWEVLYKKGADGMPRGFIRKTKADTSAKQLQIPLKPIASDEIFQIRELQKSRKLATPIFLFKEDGIYYIAKITNSMCFITSNIMDDVHMCRNCSHLSAKPVEQGGCQKVIDSWKRLENYSFIDVGYQTLQPNSKNMEVLAIVKCINYEESKGRDTKSTDIKKKIELRNSLKESLHEFK